MSSEEKMDEPGDIKDLKIIVKSLPYPGDKHNNNLKNTHQGGKGIHQNTNSSKQCSVKLDAAKKELSRTSSFENVTGADNDEDEDLREEFEHESVIVTPKKRHRLEEDRKLTSGSKTSLLKEQGITSCKRTLNRVTSSSSQGRGLSPQGAKRLSSRHSSKTEADAKTVIQLAKIVSQDSLSNSSTKRSQRNFVEAHKHRDSSEEGISRRALRVRDSSPSVKDLQDTDKVVKTDATKPNDTDEGTKRILRTRDNSPAIKTVEQSDDSIKKDHVKHNESVIKLNNDSSDEVPKRCLRARDSSPAVKVESFEDNSVKKSVREVISKLQDPSDDVSVKRLLRVRDASVAVKLEPCSESVIKKLVSDADVSIKRPLRARDISPVVKLESCEDSLIKKAASSLNKVVSDSNEDLPRRTLRARDNSPAVKLTEQLDDSNSKKAVQASKTHEKEIAPKRSLRPRDMSPAVKPSENGCENKLKNEVSKQKLSVEGIESKRTQRENDLIVKIENDEPMRIFTDDSPTAKRKQKSNEVTKDDAPTKSEDVSNNKKDKIVENSSKHLMSPPALGSLSTRSASKLSHAHSVQSLISSIPLVAEVASKTLRLRGEKKPPAGVFEPSIPENDGTPLNIELPELPLKTPPVNPISKKLSLTEKPLTIIDNNNLRPKRSNNEKENNEENKKSKILAESLVQDIKDQMTDDNIANIVSRAIKMKMKRKKINRTGFPMKKRKKKKNSGESTDVVPPILEDQRKIPAIGLLEDSTPALSPVPKIDDSKIIEDCTVAEAPSANASSENSLKSKQKLTKNDDKDTPVNDKACKHDLRPGRRKTFKEDDKNKEEKKADDKADRPKRRNDVDKSQKQLASMESETESVTSVIVDNKVIIPSKRVRRCKEDCDDR